MILLICVIYIINYICDIIVICKGKGVIIMTKISSKLSDFSNLNQIKKPDTKEVINSLTSFKNTKKFKKRDWTQVLPPMTCHKELVEKFKLEAKEKNENIQL